MENSTLRDEWNISHEFAKDHTTYFTLVTYTGDRKTDRIIDVLNNAYNDLKNLVTNDELRLVVVGATLGSADAVMVWQAKNEKAAKPFLEKVLAQPGLSTNTVVCMMSHGNGPKWPPKR